jgi:hypothetical protein
MSSSEDQTIREAIAGLISAAEPAAIVYSWNALSHNLTEWPGLFGEARHGYIVRRISQPADRKNAQRDKRHPVYELLQFDKFRVGKKSDNSTDDSAEKWQTVYNAIKAEPHLGLEGTVEYHELLQLELDTTIKCGEETLQFKRGRLPVHLCC